MADFDVTFGSDDRDLVAAHRRMRAEAQNTARATVRGVSQSMRAVVEYEQSLRSAAQATQRLARSSSQFGTAGRFARATQPAVEAPRARAAQAEALDRRLRGEVFANNLAFQARRRAERDREEARERRSDALRGGLRVATAATGAVTGGIALLNRSLSSLAERNPAAARALEEVSRASQGVSDSIGRSILPILPIVSAGIRGFGSVLSGVQDGLAAGFSGTLSFLAGRGFSSGAREALEQDRLLREQERIERRTAALPIANDLLREIELVGRIADENSRLEEIAREFAARRQRIRDIEGLDPSDPLRLRLEAANEGAREREEAAVRGAARRDRGAAFSRAVGNEQLRRAFLAEAVGDTDLADDLRLQAAANQRAAETAGIEDPAERARQAALDTAQFEAERAALARAREERARDVREEAAEQSARQKNAAERVALELRSLELSENAGRLSQRQLAVERVRLDFAQRRRSIEQDDALTQQDRAAALARLGGLEAAAISNARVRESTQVRQSGDSAAAFAGGRRQIFGTDLPVVQRQAKDVERIRRGVDRAVVAMERFFTGQTLVLPVLR